MGLDVGETIYEIRGAQDCKFKVRAHVWRKKTKAPKSLQQYWLEGLGVGTTGAEVGFLVASTRFPSETTNETRSSSSYDPLASHSSGHPPSTLYNDVRMYVGLLVREGEKWIWASKTPLDRIVICTFSDKLEFALTLTYILNSSKCGAIVGAILPKQ